MDSLTYSLIIGLIFLFGIFIFTYFETPSRTIKKGIKKVKNVQFLKLNNNKGALSVPAEKEGSSQKGKNGGDFRVYVHEY